MGEGWGLRTARARAFSTMATSTTASNSGRSTSWISGRRTALSCARTRHSHGWHARHNADKAHELHLVPASAAPLLPTTSYCPFPMSPAARCCPLLPSAISAYTRSAGFDSTGDSPHNTTAARMSAAAPCCPHAAICCHLLPSDATQRRHACPGAGVCRGTSPPRGRRASAARPAHAAQQVCEAPGTAERWRL